MEEGLIKGIFPEGFPAAEETAADYSPLVLAFMGDSVYELMVRTRLVTGGNRPVKTLHADKVSYVKADAQAFLAKAIREELNPLERSVMKRGRNAHSHTVAKHASVEDYRFATGFEALLGFLWLSGQHERLSELVELGFRKLKERDTADGKGNAGSGDNNAGAGNDSAGTEE